HGAVRAVPLRQSVEQPWDGPDLNLYLPGRSPGRPHPCEIEIASDKKLVDRAKATVRAFELQLVAPSTLTRPVRTARTEPRGPVHPEATRIAVLDCQSQLQ